MHDLLQNKKALICGASQGIGEATARLMHAYGAHIVLLARSEDKLQKICEELGERASYKVVDLMNLDTLTTCLDQIVAAEKRIDILICNSGGPKAGPLLEAAPQDMAEAFQGHLMANQLMAQKLVPAMKDAGFGRILNVISTSVKIPIPNLGVSNTIRGAHASWAKTLSMELGPFGITVNNVLPGYTKTPRLESLLQNASQKSSRPVSEVQKEWEAKVPLRRFAAPEETAEALCFLASEKASYISGINLPVDGGRTGAL